MPKIVFRIVDVQIAETTLWRICDKKVDRWGQVHVITVAGGEVNGGGEVEGQREKIMQEANYHAFFPNAYLG